MPFFCVVKKYLPRKSFRNFSWVSCCPDTCIPTRMRSMAAGIDEWSYLRQSFELSYSRPMWWQDVTQLAALCTNSPVRSLSKFGIWWQLYFKSYFKLMFSLPSWYYLPISEGWFYFLYNWESRNSPANKVAKSCPDFLVFSFCCYKQCRGNTYRQLSTITKLDAA